MQSNRLTVVGLRREVTAFQRSRWLTQLQGCHYDPVELSPTRYACQFGTDTNPLPVLQGLSRQKPGLVFLLEYDARRLKGLAMVKAGRLTHHQVRY